MDIDSIVEKLMKAERMPLNKAFQRKQTFEWQRDAYRNVNTTLRKLEDFFKNKYVFTKPNDEKNSYFFK